MGCKANQFEGSVIAQNLTQSGMTQTAKIEDADFYLLNSCTVTHKSDNEAFYLLRNAKNKNPNLVCVLTGCIAQVEKERLLENEYIDYVIGNDEKLRITEFLGINDSKCIARDVMEQTEFTETILPSNTKTRASIKIQDGCDNRCSYCIIPFARGKSRSADTEFILKQINEAAAVGFNEVVLTGIHIGQWGKDIGSNLLSLLQLIEKTDIPRYRLGSLDPLEVTDEMLEFLSKSKKFCPHFHLSLQSACDKTLQSMNRHYSVEDCRLLIEKINSKFELPFIGSDIIAGFAGETEEDFETTYQNLKNLPLTQIHVFPYSIRKGTVGATAPNQVPDKVKDERARAIRAISSAKFREFLEKNIGTTQEVLIEKKTNKNGFLKGMTRNYLSITLPLKNTAMLNALQCLELKSEMLSLTSV